MDEENFPRGGSTAPGTTKRKRKADDEQDNDLFKVFKHGGKSKPDYGDSSKKKLGKKGKLRERKKSIEQQRKPIESEAGLLLRKDLVEGMLLLGCVKSIHEFELVVSLPCGLTGTVSVTSICASYTALLQRLSSGDASLLENPQEVGALSELFHVGQCVPVRVTEVGDTARSCTLTLNPRDVNSAITAKDIYSGMVMCGCVSSVEDHGYLVDLGVKQVTAFLSNKAAKSYITLQQNGEAFKVGCYLRCQIQISTKAASDSAVRSVTLRIEVGEVNSSVVTMESGITIATLLPGMVMDISVTKSSEEGATVKFLKYEGCIHRSHRLVKKAVTEKKAAILYVHPVTKVVTLTQLSHLVKPRVDSEARFHGLSFGDLLEGCEVTHIDKKRGVCFKLTNNLKGLATLVCLVDMCSQFNANVIDNCRRCDGQSKRMLSDDSNIDVPTLFKKGSLHKCRVIDFDWTDSLVLLTCLESDLEQSFMRYADISAGMTLECKVDQLVAEGMRLKVSKYVQGFVPSMHLADVPLKHPEKKFHSGDILKVKVLNVNAETHRLICTNKRSLIKSKLPTVTEYEECEVGKKMSGYIFRIKDNGVVVRFYGAVKGFVPRSELTHERIEHPEKVFYEGQVVQCLVLNCKPQEEQLILSFKLEDRKPFASNVPIPDDFKIGALVDCRVTAKTDTGLDVSLLPSKISAFLPTEHLSDHHDNYQLLYKMNDVDDVIKGAMYVSCTHVLTLTKKPSLIQASQNGNLLTEFSQLKPGLMLAGSIKSLMTYGVFVDCLNGLVGLVPNKLLCDIKIQDASVHFHKGQSVVAKVTEVDEEKQRFLLSMRMTECYHDDPDIGLEMLENYTAESRHIIGVAQKRKGLKNLAKLSVGSIEFITVTSTTDHGILCKLEKGVNGFVTHEHMPGVVVRMGERVQAVVLHVDVGTACVQLSLSRGLIKAITNFSDTKFAQVQEDQVLKSEVQLVRSDCVLVSLRGHAAGRLAYLSTRRHLNDVVMKQLFVVGQVHSVVIRSIVEGVISASLQIHMQQHSPTNKTAEKKVMPQYKLGATLNAKIQKIHSAQLNIRVENQAGRVHITEVLDSPEEGTKVFARLKKKEDIKVKLIGYRNPKTKELVASNVNVPHALLECTMCPSKMKRKGSLPLEEPTYNKGDSVTVVVTEFLDGCVHGVVSPNVRARISNLNISNESQIMENPHLQFRCGNAYKATVLRKISDSLLALSFTGSDDIEKGSTVMGMITEMHPAYGVKLRLAGDLQAKVALTDLCDDMQDFPTKQFSRNQAVRCYILEVKGQECVASLKESRVSGLAVASDNEVQSMSDLAPEMVLQGYIRECSKKGIFVSLSRDLCGRVLLRLVSKQFVKEQTTAFQPGKLVTVGVLSIKKESDQIELSMLEKHTKVPDQLPAHLIKDSGKKRPADDDEGILGKRQKRTEGEEGAGSDSGIDEADSDMDVKIAKETSSSVRSLEVPAEFSWGTTFSLPAAGNVSESSDSESEDETAEKKVGSKTKKTRQEKQEDLKQEERLLCQTEQALMSSTQAPRTADEFDRLVVQSPDSSLVWMRYMAFHLETAEIEKARTIAEKALKTISFREEQEKLNVWVGYMNLENMYGTKETLTSVFEQALTHCDPAKVYQQLITIYVKSEKMEAAEHLYQMMVKRFSLSKDVWTGFGMFYFRWGRAESARKLMQRSLKSLDKRDHVEVLSKFAQMEFKLGEPERGRTMFENILSSYPRRTDLWSVYIDMATKANDMEGARQLYERAIHLTLPAKKMKFLYKKYLEFEQRHGSEETIRAVKLKAVEYVESRSADAQD